MGLPTSASAGRRLAPWVLALLALVLLAMPVGHRLASRAAYTDSTTLSGNTVGPNSCSTATQWLATVTGDGARTWLRLGDTDNTLDNAGTSGGTWTLTGSGTATRSIPGALFCQGGVAGNATSIASAQRAYSPSEGRYGNGGEVNDYADGLTLAVWFRGTTGDQGRLLGLSSSTSTSGSRTDRVLWVDSSGVVNFGTRPSSGSAVALNSAAGHLDGAWHLAVVVMGASSAALYVDNEPVEAVSSGARFYDFGNSTNVYWRLGSDTAGSSSRPANAPTNAFTGDLDEVVITRRALTATDVNDLYVTADAT